MPDQPANDAVPTPDQTPTHPSPPGGDTKGAFDPQRLLRIAGVTREVLDEVRAIRPDPGAVAHLRALLDQICGELRQALPAELYRELDDLTPEIREGSFEELTLAHAEILGWLQGLFQGTQLAIQLQAMQAQQEGMRRALQPPERRPAPGPHPDDSQYL